MNYLFKYAVLRGLAQVGINNDDLFAVLGKSHSEICGSQRFTFPWPGTGNQKGIKGLIQGRKHQVSPHNSVYL
jgi:hypothetical protein